MAEDYTPTDAQVRKAFMAGADPYPGGAAVYRTQGVLAADFDRWRAKQDRAVVARALKKAADDVHREARWCLEMAMRGQPQNAVARLEALEG